MFCYLNGKPTIQLLKDIVKLHEKSKSKVQFVGTGGKLVDLINTKKYKKETAEIVFQDGLRIGATLDHKFLLEDGSLKEVADLKVGDVIKRERHNLLKIKDGIWDYDWGWFIGLYLAEGSISNGDVQLSLCDDETKWLKRINKTFSVFGVKFNCYFDKDNRGITFHSSSPIPKAIVDTFIRGKYSSTKHLRSEAFSYGIDFIRGILDGFIDGDGYNDIKNNRIDIGICNNRELTANLRIICWLCGYAFRSNLSWVNKDGKVYGRRKIKIKKQLEFLHLKDTRIKKILRKEGLWNVYDIEVTGDSLFCLSNGAVSHNSKLNPTNACKRFWEHEYPMADVSFLGHTHQSEQLTWERGGQERIALIGGTYKLSDDYARKRGIGGRAGQPGHAILFYPNEKRMVAFKHLEDSQDFMLNLIFKTHGK
jgi:intein/homing endonuclease